MQHYLYSKLVMCQKACTASAKKDCIKESFRVWLDVNSDTKQLNLYLRSCRNSYSGWGHLIKITGYRLRHAKGHNLSLKHEVITGSGLINYQQFVSVVQHILAQAAQYVVCADTRSYFRGYNRDYWRSNTKSYFRHPIRGYSRHSIRGYSRHYQRLLKKLF